MSFSVEWDKRYRSNTHMSVWPWTDLVSNVMRYASPFHPDYRILELGCGAGANIPFFNKLEIQYYGVEGSPFIVDKLHETFPDLSSRIKVADFTHEIPFDIEFDLIIDRAGLTCNSTESIQRAINLIHQGLKKDGKYIGIDWYSRDYTYFAKGEDIDPYTHIFEEGPFMNTGPVHFSDKKHLLDLFNKFEILSLVHKTHKQEASDDSFVSASWDVVAQKRTSA